MTSPHTPHVHLFLLAAALVLLTARQLAAQHAGDIFLGIDDCRIVTGQDNDGDDPTIPVRVFSAAFGDSGCAAFTSNPGFDTFAGMFEVGTQLCWNAVDGLKVWNGSGLEPTGGETIEVSLFSQSVTVGDDPTNGFCLFVQSDGGFHKHIDFCMNGCPNGCNPPPDADPGIYVLTLEIESTDPALEPSKPFWIVFNYLDSSTNQQDVMDWIQANLAGAPCPQDINADDAVDINDLLAVLAAWGSCPTDPQCCPEDIDDSGAVDINDLLAVLAAWGPCINP